MYIAVEDFLFKARSPSVMVPYYSLQIASTRTRKKLMNNIYLDKILSGDRHAFRYFISTYKDMAFSVAISMVKNELFAEEVVQDSFVEAYLSLASFKKQAKFSTWFYKIVVRTAYKYRQKNKISDIEFVIEKHDQS